jgi:hypothetical protein
MGKTLRLAAAVWVCLLLTTAASAQVGVTFVTQSGERVSGSLVDFGARGIEASVGGQTRMWSPNELAVIDFTNTSSYPANEVNQVNGGNHVLVLRDGSVLVGKLYDVGGQNPLRISFTTGGGTRDFSSNEVARIYLSRPSGSGSGSENLQPGSGRISVPATSDWVSTGISVTQGQQLQFTTTGEVRLSADSSDVAVSAGSKKGRYANSAPLPNALAGALIGRIGNGAPFGIGNMTSITAPSSGMLYLRVNDDQLADNAGAFGVDIVAGRRPRR